MLLSLLVAYDTHRIVPSRLLRAKQVLIDLMLDLIHSASNFVLGCVLNVPTVEASLILRITELAVSNTSNLLLRLKIVLLRWDLRLLSAHLASHARLLQISLFLLYRKRLKSDLQLYMICVTYIERLQTLLENVLKEHL